MLWCWIINVLSFPSCKLISKMLFCTLSMHNHHNGQFGAPGQIFKPSRLCAIFKKSSSSWVIKIAAVSSAQRLDVNFNQNRSERNGEEEGKRIDNCIQFFVVAFNHEKYRKQRVWWAPTICVYTPCIELCLSVHI